MDLLGVDRYEIQKLNANGQWETINTTNNLNNEIIINEHFTKLLFMSFCLIIKDNYWTTINGFYKWYCSVF